MYLSSRIVRVANEISYKPAEIIRLVGRRGTYTNLTKIALGLRESVHFVYTITTGAGHVHLQP